MEMIRVERSFDIVGLNRIANLDSVRPWLGGSDTPIDLGPLLKMPGNIALRWDGGAVIAAMIQPGFYDIHTMAEARGRTLEAFHDCLFWLFTRADAVEIMARVPLSNPVAATAFDRVPGRTYEGRRTMDWRFNGKPEPVDIYGIKIQDWIRTSPRLPGVGKRFRADICDATGTAMEPDAEMDRAAGMAAECLRHGQHGKAEIFFNRWAAMAMMTPIHVVSFDPMVLDIGTRQIKVMSDTVEAMPCQ